MRTRSTIPVHILTGFLGSGKTTLLNHALTSSSGFGADTAIVVNEFGDVALDQMFIQERSEETLVLKSGCICCSIRTDLVSTLTQLAAMSDARERPLKRVVIETSGISDPAPILTTLGSDFRLLTRFHLGAIVCAVDAAASCATASVRASLPSSILPSDNRKVRQSSAFIGSIRVRPSFRRTGSHHGSSHAMHRTGTWLTFWRASSRRSPHSRRGILSAVWFCVRQARRHGRDSRSG